MKTIQTVLILFIMYLSILKFMLSMATTDVIMDTETMVIARSNGMSQMNKVENLKT
jgi:hypothetical protein